MTLVKPSTITSQSGAYQYKGQLTSPSLNYIDNQFPNLIDNTGGTMQGILTIANGAAINVLSGGTVTVQSGGDINMLTGSLLLADTVIITTSLDVDGTFNTDGVATFGDKISFHNNVSNPTITQNALTASAGGQAMSITAQSAHTSGQGGSIVLAGGSGAGSNMNGGSIQLIGGAGTGGSGVDGVIILGQASQTLLTLGNVGMQVGQNSVTISAGANHLTIAQESVPMIKLTSGSLSGDATVTFQTGFGPAIFMLATAGIAFNGHVVHIKCGSFEAFQGSPISNTSNVNFWVVINDDDTCTLIGA
jgi:hypothetical protein